MCLLHCSHPLSWSGLRVFTHTQGEQYPHDFGLPESYPERWLDQIDKCKDQDPDEVHKVPVESSDLNWIGILRRIGAAGSSNEDADQIDYSTRDVHAMEARQNEERRAKKGGR